jgi:hypothetical protein
MKKKLLVGLIGGMIAMSAGAAFAQPAAHLDGVQVAQYHRAYRIQHRIDAQEREIRHGLRNGSLTHREARMLRDNLSHIKRAYRHAKRNDQYVSREERARIDHMLDRNGRMIRRMENNGITRF